MTGARDEFLDALRAIQPEKLAELVQAGRKLQREAGAVFDFMTYARRALGDQLHEAEHRAHLATARANDLRAALQD